jgi:ubiquinone/menaquinone biosynthesis C-methylase UbiE
MAGYQYKPRKRLGTTFRRYFTSRIGDGRGNHERDYLDILDLLIELKRGGSFLDIGCGWGRMIVRAAGKMNEIVGLEPDPALCQEARQIVAEREVPSCHIVGQTSFEYMADNPGKVFDLVLLSMVLQHVSTDMCRRLIEDTARLVKTDGLVVLATSHASEATKGFTYEEALAGERHLSPEVYDRYAENTDEQEKGLPMRRLSREELLALVSPHFDVLLWRPFSYIRPEKCSAFARSLDVSPEEIRDVALLQVVVLRKLVHGPDQRLPP